MVSSSDSLMSLRILLIICHLNSSNRDLLASTSMSLISSLSTLSSSSLFPYQIQQPHPAIADTAAMEIKKQQAEQGGAGVVKRKPVFLKVSDLKPGTTGNTLAVKVLSSTIILDKKSRNSLSLNSRSGAAHTRIAECLIDDETGTILFTARNAQVDLMKPGSTVIIRNAKIDMFKGSMRLAVDKWGRIEVTEPANFSVEEDNNLSLVEYELVNVIEE
ncbi:hypothetical protein L2E82_31188 [Cichorium intybus]|uniref:Uncharacterized protein n=1 Tax=Cichorium intybus TaxID=13427 RepID=A0ACB9D2C1_CICIN|nr:hypothetical protein L2E82_31188 [Cichorium intybus]